MINFFEHNGRTYRFTRHRGTVEPIRDDGCRMFNVYPSSRYDQETGKYGPCFTAYIPAFSTITEAKAAIMGQKQPKKWQSRSERRKTMPTEIKPCPFCGVLAVEQQEQPLPFRTLAICTNCRARVNLDDWNSRPIEDAQAARIAELEAQLAAVPRWTRLTDDPATWPPDDMTGLCLYFDGTKTYSSRSWKYLRELCETDAANGWRADINDAWIAIPNFGEADNDPA